MEDLLVIYNTVTTADAGFQSCPFAPREDDEKGDGKLMGGCGGEECMMWRWVEGDTLPVVTDKNPFPFGYCALAGHPNTRRLP